MLQNTTLKKCKKCGEPLEKSKRKSYPVLDGYTPDEELCVNCNAAESVLERLRENKDIDICDLKKLPKTIMFDPAGADDLEKEYVEKFERIINQYTAIF